MKRKEFLTSITFSLVSFCGLGVEPPAKAEIKTRRVCEKCKFWLGKSIVMQKGVKDAIIDVKNNSITVVYNANKTNIEDLKKYIVSIGYDADSLKADVHKRDLLRDCCITDITICK